MTIALSLAKGCPAAAEPVLMRAGANLIQKRDDAPCVEVDVQIQRFLGGGPFGGCGVIDLVGKMQPLGVGADDLGPDTDRIVQQQFAEIQGVDFCGPWRARSPDSSPRPSASQAT